MRTLKESAILREVEARLARMLPQRTAVLGEAGLRTAVREAAARARSFGLTGDQLLAYAAFEFVFGSDFSRNPRYPWAEAILRESALPPAERMQKLREAGIFFLAAEEEALERGAMQAAEEAEYERAQLQEGNPDDETDQPDEFEQPEDWSADV